MGGGRQPTTEGRFLNRRVAPTPLRPQEATRPQSADAPGFRLHPRKGNRAGQPNVRVSGKWWVLFRFEDGKTVDVD